MMYYSEITAHKILRGHGYHDHHDGGRDAIIE